MVAKTITHAQRIQDNSGQSILEVVFILPFLFLFVGMLYKINMAIQMAINNTQYARSQIYVLTANSPEYPRYAFRFLEKDLFGMNNQDRMVLGVSDPKAISQAASNDSSIEPLPQTTKINRAGTTVKGSNERGEVNLRNEIRVRNTSAICTQLNSVGSKTPWSSSNVVGLKSKRWPFGQTVCQYSGKKEG
ncbi:MAG: hypothetical protein JST80_10400 [Bdellovibrionales bacterium]|nr:hypothetical protein [Bdellovibrionales bacterium]